MQKKFDEFPSLRDSDKFADGEEEVVYVPYTKIIAENLNLQDELLKQYNITQQLLHDATYDKDIPLNQKSQVIGAANAILSSLIRSQAELYSLERVKKIENCLIATLQAFPDLQETFMKAYTEVLSA